MLHIKKRTRNFSERFSISSKSFVLEEVASSLQKDTNLRSFLLFFSFDDHQITEEENYSLDVHVNPLQVNIFSFSCLTLRIFFFQSLGLCWLSKLNI